MKKFFKSLALVLALVLIVGSLPMNNAKAADITLKNTAKTLWWNPGDDGKNIGAIGTTADGTASPKFRGFAVKVLNAGEAKITGKSDNKAVAKFVNGKIWAKGAGEAVVTIFADGKEVGNILVTVKTPSTKVTINDPGVTAIGIGEKVIDLGLTKDGTDHTTYKLTAGADIATIDEKGVITTKAPGEIKVQAYSYQGSKYNAPIAKSEELTLKVAATLESVKQISSKKVALTFDSEMDAAWVTADKVALYIENGDVKNTVYKYDGKVTKDNKKEVTFEAYAAFEGGKTYKVEYEGKVLEFEAAKLTAQNAAGIVVNTKEAVYGTTSNIDFKVVDANGIEIEGAKAYVTFSLADSTFAYASVNGQQITIYQEGKIADVKATYNYGYFDEKGAYQTTKFETTFKITGVKAAPFAVKSVEWNIGACDFDAWNYAQNTIFAVGDSWQLLQLRVKSSDGTTELTTDNTGLTIESANNEIVMVNAATGEIYPVKAGTATITVKQNNNAIYSIPVTVVAARTVSTISITASSDYLNTTTSGAYSDTVTYTAKVKDQYGADVTNANLKVVALSADTVSLDAIKAVAAAHPGSSYTFTLTGSTITGLATKNGSIGLSFYAEKNGVKTNSVQKQLFCKNVDPALGANGYAIVLDDAGRYNKTIDTKVTTGEAIQSITVKYAQTRDGYRIAAVTPASISGTIHYDVVGVDNAFVSGSTINGYKTANRKIEKLVAGTYMVRLFNGQTLVSTDTITVKDSQPALSVTWKGNNALSTVTADADGVLAGVADCFEVKYDGEVVEGANVKFYGAEGTGFVFVEKVGYTITNTPAGDATYEVTAKLGKTLTK